MILIYKAIIYRVFRLLIILMIALITTGSIAESITISFLDSIVATIYYYYFDSFWTKIVEK